MYRTSLPAFSIRQALGGALCLVILGTNTVRAQPSGEYTVYPAPIESPNHTTPLPPADARMLVVAPADLLASPFYWHDTDGVAGPEATTLEGNNVRVFTDEMPPIPPPDCGPDLECTFPLDLASPPITYSAASQAQVFYVLNLFHDVTFRHGFDSAAGNFQVNTYGGGGVGGDPLMARLLYGINCGPTVSVPPDGSSASLNVTPCIDRDIALDATAVLHLAGHTMAARLVGGPANVSCLSNTQTPLEGWADYLGLLFTIEAGDAGTDPRPYITYFLGQPPDGPGARSQPYSTDPAVNTMSYGDIVTAGNPLSVGEVFAQVLWEMTWSLIDVHGFDPDLANAEGGAGNQRALAYIVEGMKLTACQPTFLDARDGILAAALALNGDEDVCRIWEAFAAMGMGEDAFAGSPNTTAQVIEGFAVPAACGAFFLDGFESGDCTAWSAAIPGC